MSEMLEKWVFYGFFHGFSMFSMGFSMVSPWFSKFSMGFPMVSPWFSMFSMGFSMVSPWFSMFSMGFSMVSPWFSMFSMGFSMVSPWFSSFLWVFPWFLHGNPMGFRTSQNHSPRLALNHLLWIYPRPWMP